MKIKYVLAREILDSRGIPTISTLLQFEDGTTAKGDVPSGASTGKNEVLELRDGDVRRYRGKGVLTAVDNINNLIAPQIIGKEFNTQEEFDKFLINLDGTESKTNLGGNSILSLSMAFCRATSISKKIPLYDYFARIYWGEGYDKSKLELPEPMILVMEGGAHGNWATDFQEYMIVPRKDKFPLFKDALRAGAEVFHAIHDILVEKHYSATVGFEGAFAPIQIQSNTEAFDIMLDGIESAGYKPEEDIFISIDIAASEFYDSNLKSYILKREGKTLTTDEWLQLQTEWFAKYPINIIEDPMDQEDWYGWQQLVAKIGDKKDIVGDDLLTTNVKRINEAVQKKAANTLLVKPNQIGTITETIAAIKLAEQSGWDAIISHRSGETNDDMIADMVVGTYGSHSKFGGPDRGERLAKYNRLTEIEMYLGKA